MIKRVLFPFISSSLFISLLFIQLNCESENNEMTQEEMVARGEYLVTFSGCNDCHSPKIFTELGPRPDTMRLLSGHPSDIVLAPIDTSMVSPGKWILAEGKHFTAWVGPWGISYSPNLTPDEPTGIGTWTNEIFIKALRNGKHMGFGRQILPPMPWFDIAQMTDEDLKSVFAYLKSLPPIRNQVPDPVPPNMLGEMENEK
jgi:mono/diheme cytochrome c family protein